jgi:L-ribulose-5-phosphate 3-epimerase UlaE
MVKDPTISQLVKAKKEIEEEIEAAVNKFEEEYGIHVKDVQMVTTKSKHFFTREVEILFDINKD